MKRKKEQIREDFCLGTIRYYDEFGKALDEGYSLSMYVHFRHVSTIYETTLFIQYCTVELYMYYLLRNHKVVIRQKEVNEKQET